MSHRGSLTSMVGWTPATPTQMNPIYELSINRQTFFGPNNQNSYQDKSHYHKKNIELPFVFILEQVLKSLQVPETKVSNRK